LPLTEANSSSPVPPENYGHPGNGPQVHPGGYLP